MAEGGRQKAEGGRQKAKGRRLKTESRNICIKLLAFSLKPSVYLIKKVLKQQQ
jgi:hypothetical protein